MGFVLTCLTSTSIERLMFHTLCCPKCGLLCMPIVEENVCVSVFCLCVCVVLGAAGDKFSTLASDWRQWPFILHCPT